MLEAGRPIDSRPVPVLDSAVDGASPEYAANRAAMLERLAVLGEHRAQCTEDERASSIGHREGSERWIEFGDALAQQRLQAYESCAAKAAQQADRRVVHLIEGVAAVEHIDVQIALLAQPRKAPALAQHRHD